jgi:MFS family permease
MDDSNISPSSTLGTSVYTPAVFLLEDHFQISREVALLGLSLFTFGLALGPLIAAPLSEVRGRLIVYQISLVFLLGFTAEAGCAQNIETLLICRFLAGTGGSAAMAVGAGTIADLWDGEGDARDKGLAAIAFVLSGYLGPTLGRSDPSVEAQVSN